MILSNETYTYIRQAKFRMMNCFTDDKIYIHISYHILGFVWQTKTSFTIEQLYVLTYCLSYIVNNIPAGAQVT